MTTEIKMENNDVIFEIKPLARNKSLTEPIDLLKQYKRNSNRKRRGHIKSESYYRNLGIGLLIASGVISALGAAINIVGAADATPSKTYILVAAGMGIISSLVTTLQGVFKPQSKALEHRGSQLRYGTVVKEVDKMLVKDRSDPKTMDKDIEKIIDITEHADENAPSFPTKFHKYAISASESPSVSRNR